MSKIVAALRAGEVGDAMTLAGEALAQGVRTPLTLHLSADSLLARQRPDLALPLLDEASARAPGQADLLMSRGCALAALDRHREAIAAYDAAILTRPTFAVAHFAKGQVLEQIGELEGARAAYEQAARQPGYAEPRAALAFIAVNAGRSAQARALAQEALDIAPDYRAPRATLASADLLDGDYPAAERRLRRLLAGQDEGANNRGALLKLLGDALHGQRRHDEAWKAYADAGRTLNADYLRRSPHGEGVAFRQAVQLRRQFAEVDPGLWSVAADRDQPGRGMAQGHAFLVGFPRSGTTLLDQALARHPDVVGLEERPTLAAPLDGLLSGAISMRAMASLPVDQAKQLRELYWSRVEALAPGRVAGRVVVDKMPLNLLHLPTIRRLFPKARIIFALRDPRDVVLSCFRQRFLLTPAMAEFTEITSAARYYDAVMQLAQSYFAGLPLAVHTHRYEDMVADFDGRLGAVLQFLGLPWRDEVRRFAERSEILVNTPSARQISQGLYTRGMGQWRSYARFMTEANAVLAPWISAYGYEPD